MMNVQKMMQKAQEMQEKMASLQEELGNKEVEGESGGGLVKCRMNCKKQIKSLTVDPSLVNKDEIDMLEDLVTAAVNDAGNKADIKMAEETQKAMSDMGIPPGMLGGGGLPF